MTVMSTVKNSESAVAQNVTPVSGGEVHLPHAVFETWPHCRTYGSNRVRSQYRPTSAEVTCKHCREQIRRRELAAAKRSR